ncbi:MAG: DUF4492 domain-containing protein [Prevotellaceae bacterium]|jgi:hypothetical protein|nr:DUF4492 domain-containing protein [Prevotellaceae bacterium]
MPKSHFYTRIFRFYYDGFRSMTIGKTLWAIILIKLFVMFLILKVFFFPNFLNEKADTETGKQEYVSEELINRSK